MPAGSGPVLGVATALPLLLGVAAREHQQPRSLQLQQLSGAGADAGPPHALLSIIVCGGEGGKSAGAFELTFPLSPSMSPITVQLHREEHYTQEIPVVGPPPSALALRALSSDAICIERLAFDGVEGQPSMTVWLDNPCDRFYGASICSAYRMWYLPPRTTTTVTSTRTTATTTLTTTTSVTATSTQTTTTSVTATSTQTTTTSVTATSTQTTTSVTATSTQTTTSVTATSTQTTTSVTTTSTQTSTPANATVAAAPNGAEALVAAMVPPTFYDEVNVELEFEVQRAAARDYGLEALTADLRGTIADFLALAPPSSVALRLQWLGGGRLRTPVQIRVYELADTRRKAQISRLSSRSVSQEVADTLADPSALAPFNVALEERMREGRGRRAAGRAAAERRLGSLAAAGAGGNSTSDPGKSNVLRCDPGAMICCMRAVVVSIVSNAGVIRAYHGYFLMSAAMNVIFILLAARARYGWSRDEHARGRFVMPLFAFGIGSQVALDAYKAVDKYQALVEGCRSVPEGPGCPPSPWALVLELALFGLVTVVLLAAFLRWWNRQWRADCALERSRKDPRVLGVTPLESLLRRSDLLSCLAIRKTDAARKTDRHLQVVASVFLAFAVTLTSFFSLQSYRVPCGLVAWCPYKRAFEVFLTCAARLALKKVVWARWLSHCARRLLCLAAIAALLAFDAWSWVQIFRIFSAQGRWDTWQVLRILDITLGAGWVNLILSHLAVTLSTYLFSVYCYEPLWRSSWLQCRYLTRPADAEGVEALLAAGGGEEKAWQVEEVVSMRGVQFDCMSESDAEDSEQASTLGGLLGHLERSKTDAVVVKLSKRNMGCCRARVLFAFDYMLNVESCLPVAQLEDGADSRSDEEELESAGQQESDDSASEDAEEPESASENAEESSSGPSDQRRKWWRDVCG